MGGVLSSIVNTQLNIKTKQNNNINISRVGR